MSTTTVINTPPPLFSGGDADDLAYRNIRDEVSEPARICKQVSERLWSQYHAYADDHFLVEIRRDFDARFWEMYLTCSILEYAPRFGYAVTCPKPGPDILVERQGRRVWIEAIVATDGDPSKPDSAIANPSGKVPDEKIILRYVNAIDAKHKKYIVYRKNGLVHEDDAYIIAVNGFPLSYRWAEPEIPRILKAVFPIGAYEVLIDRDKMTVVGTQHQFRPAVTKLSGNIVSTNAFLNDDYHGLSGVLYSCANACSQGPMGIDFILIHNPLASQPVPLGFIPAGREYRATQLEDRYELKQHPGNVTRVTSFA